MHVCVCCICVCVWRHIVVSELMWEVFLCQSQKLQICILMSLDCHIKLLQWYFKPRLCFQEHYTENGMKGLKSIEKDAYNEITNYFRYCLFSIQNLGENCIFLKTNIGLFASIMVIMLSRWQNIFICLAFSMSDWLAKKYFVSHPVLHLGLLCVFLLLAIWVTGLVSGFLLKKRQLSFGLGQVSSSVL